MQKSNKGFIHFIFLIIVILVILGFLGFKPEEIWDDYIVKGLAFLWGIILWFVEFFTSLLNAAWKALGVLKGIFDGINNGN